MRKYLEAIKKTKAYNMVKRDKSSGRLSHSYLLVSEDKEYLEAFAKELAKIMLNIEENQVAINKVDKDIHPDVLIYGKEEKLKTQVASEISTDAYVRPYEGDSKVYVLLNMQDANDASQNKLLKIIEEPPKSVFFVLASSQENKLLNTILSRCKKINLDLIDRETIMNMLVQDGVENKLAQICASCSGGIYSRAFKMSTDKEFSSLYQNIFNCLYKMNSSRDVLLYSSMFSQKNVSKEEFADLFMLIARDLLMAKTGVLSLVNNSHKIDEIKLISQSFSISALNNIIKYCLQLKEDLVYNTNQSAAIDHFLLCVVEAKVKCKE